MTDQTIKCQDCGKEFIFSVDEQKFYEQKNFITPKRCRDCRNAKKNRYISYNL